MPPLGGRVAASLEAFTRDKPEAVGDSSEPALLPGNADGENIKGYVPPLGGRVAASLEAFAQDKPKAAGDSSEPALLPGKADVPVVLSAEEAAALAVAARAATATATQLAGLGEQSAAEQPPAAAAAPAKAAPPAAAAAPAKAAAGDPMSPVASTAGLVKGPGPGMSMSERAERRAAWLDLGPGHAQAAQQRRRRRAGSAAGSAAPAATAAPTKAGAGASTSHWGATAGFVKGPGPSMSEKAERRAAWLDLGPGIAQAAQQRRRRRAESAAATAAPAKAAADGSTSHTAPTVGPVGKGPTKYEQARARARVAWLSSAEGAAWLSDHATATAAPAEAAAAPAEAAEAAPAPAPAPAEAVPAEAAAVATTTTAVDVFIESTDAFQVVFYANYFKFFEYGLPGRLRAVDGMKYAKPAKLGDSLEVETTTRDDGRFDQRILRGGDALMTATTSTADVTVAALGAAPPEGGVRAAAVHVARHDDLDGRGGKTTAAYSDGSLSLDACLRAFERTRSTFLGGPAGLAALQDSGVIVVVALVDKLRFKPVDVALGAEVDVLADVTLARTRIVFDQAVAVGGAPAARARITCVCVDAETGRPRAPPDAVKDLFA